MSEMKRINVKEIKRNIFYQMPKWLFTEDKYKTLTNDCKVAYMLLKDRNELSLKTAEEKGSFIDENGDVYFVYTAIELADILQKSGKTVTKIKRELIKARLLEEKRLGRGMANRYYLLEPTFSEQNSRNVKTTLLETDDTRNVNITLLETENLRPINNNIIKTKLNNNNIVNKEAPVNKSLHDELLEIANSFYSKFAVGRWNKREWNTMIKQFIEETIKEQRPMNNKKGYVYGSILNMAYKHDLKHNKIELESGSGIPFINYSQL